MRLVLFAAPYRVDEYLGGIGLRVWELAQVLAAEGITVTIAAAPPSGAAGLSWPGVGVVACAEETWPALIEDCDAVFTTDLPDPRVLLAAHRAERLIITENAVPYEHLHYARLRAAPDPEACYREILDVFGLQVLLTDHFIVRSEPERVGLLAALAASGRLTCAHHAISATLSHLISTLPVGFNRFSDDRAAAARAVVPPVDFLWNGGIWDYLDPAAALDGLARLRADGFRPTLRFLYPPPPDIPAAAQLTVRARELDLADQVQIGDAAVPHSVRDGYVKAARVILCLGKDGIENQTCHRLRLRDALLYGIPVLIDDRGASGTWVQATGIGRAVNPADTPALAEAMHALAADGPVRRAFIDAIDARRGRWTYESNLTGLLHFLDAGRRAPDAGSPWQTRTLDDLVSARPFLIQPPRRLL